MSQIGYMIMGVCSAAYAAGLFHLMTHAFFKALLFMAAGSVIAAMAGEQNLDRMGGFRSAMPFTFGCMVIGGLALAGVPPFAGFFSKDEILALVLARDDWHIVLGVLGYVGSFLTAIYTWRMIFRAFFGEPGRAGARARARAPLPRARAHQPGDRRGRGHRRRLPRPGAPHRRARVEHEGRDGPARGRRGRRRASCRSRRSPTCCTRSSSRRSTTRASTRSSSRPTALTWIGLAVGALLALGGIALAYRLWVQDPARAGRAARALRGRARASSCTSGTSTS